MSTPSQTLPPRNGDSATPGSYGLAPGGFRLPSETRLGPVRLQVADLARSVDFYQAVLGMGVLDREGSEARLGVDGALLELVERPDARPVPRRGRTGLFHFAILLPDRPSLGRFARHARQQGLPLGAADHAVSEALYLADPDGLGIEVYADRPRSAWRRNGQELRMTTDRLDLPGLEAAAGDAPWADLPRGTVMGHVHLHVGDLATARAFYSEALGFDRTVWTYPGALFFGAGGYHHHLGTNVWAGPGATPPADDEAQLLEWTLELPDEEAVTAAAESLEAGGYAVDRRGRSGELPEAATKDPWGTPLRLRVAR